MPTALDPMPDIDLRHLIRLTDDTGMFQHALYASPDANHGYCIDDNARALIAGILHAVLRPDQREDVPLHTYLAFMHYAWNEDTRTFRNFMGYDRRWLEDAGSHDSQGRTVWALGLTVRHAPTPPIRQIATEMYRRSLPPLANLNYNRSWAFSLLGLDSFLAAHPDDGESLTLRDRYATLLFDAYQQHATPDWPWWEDLVTYDNAKLPHALLLVGRAMNRADMTHAGLTALHWLLGQQRVVRDDGRAHLSIIGNDGWLKRGQPRAPFDQQPLEAYALLDACLAAATLLADQPTLPDDAAEHYPTDINTWLTEARMCLDWFLGHNDLDTPLFDPVTGGGRDGLQPNGANLNQGAESSLAYLLSVLELHHYQRNTNA